MSLQSTVTIDDVIRRAVAGDTDAIARLHAASWRRHYRGAYSDLYLDGDLDADRKAVWRGRLLKPGDSRTFIAEKGGTAAGFVHVELDADPVWGALVDNLHVTYELQGAGIGTQLLGAAAEWAHERRPESGMYLWVLEQNTKAQGFYCSRGGRLADRAPVPAPNNDPRNLAGRPFGIRVAWCEPGALAARIRGAVKAVSFITAAASVVDNGQAIG